MQKDKLKLLFEEGVLESANIFPVPMIEDQWYLELKKKNGQSEVLSRVRREEEKRYKRINGAIADAQEIGFKRVTIEYN